MYIHTRTLDVVKTNLFPSHFLSPLIYLPSSIFLSFSRRAKIQFRWYGVLGSHIEFNLVKVTLDFC